MRDGVLRRVASWVGTVACVFLLAACGDPDRPVGDAGARLHDAGADAGSEDAGSPTDAGPPCDGCEVMDVCYAPGESLPTTAPCTRCTCGAGGIMSCSGSLSCDAGT